MRIMLVWLNILVLAGLAGTARAQTIRVDVNLVNLAFVARDSQGKLVENLTRDFFPSKMNAGVTDVIFPITPTTAGRPVRAMSPSQFSPKGA
jgi:hypothetical protein